MPDAATNAEGAELPRLLFVSCRNDSIVEIGQERCRIYSYMEDMATNLAEVAADRVTLWSAASLEHRDIRELFVTSEQMTRPVRMLQQVGGETDELLVYQAATNDQVPVLADLVAYIEQERLGAGSVVNK
jgi:hypothetical protein